ncbi:hypothetical protein [Butyrivibrio sp. AC2005]|uniref:hypothetical protein n=1 Tax=Butyrivibrio sp. AC2005 TaxID=1280672 RepID=UPI0012DEF49E|nr:hypothetical protein [Butyrivibrio sp. AC2005]
MTTFRKLECKCAICGTTSEFDVLSSSNTCDGGPDLDTRPAEMYRSTMHLWLQECPKCKYVSGNISDRHNISREWLNSNSYRWCDGHFFMSSLAKRFYRHYLIAMESKDYKEAFYAILHCAWVCDDKKDIRNAIRCRKLALPLVTDMIEDDYYSDNYSSQSNDASLILLKADIMRRAKRFNEVVNEFSSKRLSDDRMNDYLQFEIEKAKAKDNKCYCTDDVPFTNHRPTYRKRPENSTSDMKKTESNEGSDLFDLPLL